MPPVPSNRDVIDLPLKPLKLLNIFKVSAFLSNILISLKRNLACLMRSKNPRARRRGVHTSVNVPHAYPMPISFAFCQRPWILQNDVASSVPGFSVFMAS